MRARQQRAVERGRSNDAVFRLEDYRDVDGRFDRIVSVGMFEHVGVGHYDTFFRKCAKILDKDGVFLLHTIGRSGPPSITNAWIAKYIFPGGYIPALSEVLPPIQRARLVVTDVEILQLHYAETLKAWRERFLAHREEVERLYDARFVRMWEFYLASSEMAFRESDMVVFQIQMAKRKGVVPQTRDYIGREEARLRAARSHLTLRRCALPASKRAPDARSRRGKFTLQVFDRARSFRESVPSPPGLGIPRTMRQSSTFACAARHARTGVYRGKPRPAFPSAPAATIDNVLVALSRSRCRQSERCR